MADTVACRHHLFDTILHNIKATDADNFSLERELYNYAALKKKRCYIAGTDEAGRGPLAGPVVAATVILPAQCNPKPFIDSKKLTPLKRRALYERLKEIGAIIGIGIAEAAEIDAINILQASLSAMKRATLQLSPLPCCLLIDGKFTVPQMEQYYIAQRAFIKGETKSASIAAASIVAKVMRDALMEELDQKYPLYGFSRHKGYPTKAHKTAIAQYGICPEHRRSFRGVREFA